VLHEIYSMDNCIICTIDGTFPIMSDAVSILSCVVVSLQRGGYAVLLGEKYLLDW
jgi:hypothetical protein